MNKIKIGIIAVLLLIASAGVYYYYMFSESSENMFDFPGEDSNVEITGKIDLSLTFSDGSTKKITGEPGNPLTVEYDGQEVTQVKYDLNAKASTPAGKEPYDEVTVCIIPNRIVDYSGSADENFNLYAECYQSTNSPIWTHTYLAEDQSLYDVFNSITLVPDSGEWSTLFVETIQMNDVFSNNDPGGTYTFRFDADGYGIYKGTGSRGTGEWQEIDFNSEGLTCSYSLEFTDQEVNVNWETDVTWS